MPLWPSLDHSGYHSSSVDAPYFQLRHFLSLRLSPLKCSNLVRATAFLRTRCRLSATLKIPSRSSIIEDRFVRKTSIEWNVARYARPGRDTNDENNGKLGSDLFSSRSSYPLKSLRWIDVYRPPDVPGNNEVLCSVSKAALSARRAGAKEATPGNVLRKVGKPKPIVAVFSSCCLGKTSLKCRDILQMRASGYAREHREQTSSFRVFQRDASKHRLVLANNKQLERL